MSSSPPHPSASVQCWNIPTDNIATTPLQGLRSYVLQPRPTEQSVSLNPLENVQMPFDALSTKTSSSTGLSSESRASRPGRKMTESGLVFWKKYLRDGKSKLSIELNDDLLEQLDIKLQLVLAEETDQPSDQGRGLDRWNQIADAYDFEQFTPLDHDDPHPTRTYSERSNDNAVAPFLDETPNLGGEIGLTGRFQASVCKLANHFVCQPCYFKQYTSLYIRKWTAARLFGSGTTDLTALQSRPRPSGRQDIRPIIFEHKPYMSQLEVVRLIIALRLETLEIRLINGRPEVVGEGSQLLTRATTNMLLQIVEQLHLNRARYCLLGTWDSYFVFYLSRKHRINCSDVFVRDLDDSWNKDTLIKKARLRKNTDLHHLLDDLKPSNYTLLRIVVALMIEVRPENPNDNLWSDPENKTVVPLYKDILKRLRQRRGEQADPSTEEDEIVRQRLETATDHTHVGTCTRNGSGPLDGDSRTTDIPAARNNRAPHEQDVLASTVISIETISSYREPDAEARNYQLLSGDSNLWRQEEYGFWPRHPSDRSSLPASSSIPSMTSDGSDRVMPDIVSPDLSGEQYPQAVNVKLSSYISSGQCYDTYRGMAEVRYPGFEEMVSVPIVAKYIDTLAADPADPGIGLRHEDRLYRSDLEIYILRKLSETEVAPQFYGAWRDASEARRWLITEDCGEEVDLGDDKMQQAVEEAYDLVHRCGVVHNDVKPSHILSLSGHSVKIVDWEGGDVEEHDWFGNSFGNKIFKEKRWVRSVLHSARPAGHCGDLELDPTLHTA